MHASAKLFVGALVAAFVAGALVDRCSRPSTAALTARADTLDRAAATLDSTLVTRQRADTVRFDAAATHTATARRTVAAIADTATRAANAPPSAPESCPVQLAGLKAATLRLAAASRAALDSAAAELALWQGTVASRDSTIGALQQQRDQARTLVRDALTLARPWPLWRKILAAGSCITMGYSVAQKATTPAMVAGAACLASFAL